MNVCPGSTATCEAVCSAKDNKETGPGRVGRPVGVCRAGAAATSPVEQVEQVGRPAFPPPGHAEPRVPQTLKQAVTGWPAPRPTGDFPAALVSEGGQVSHHL